MFKVGIIGPESTGKSTLSQYLAKRYDGLWLPEYARIYLEERAQERGSAYAYTHEDVLRIAEYQVKQLHELSQQEGLAFFDTELIITKVWLLHKYGECPAFVEEALRKYPMDMYLLCYPDLQWQPDPVRENPNIREYLFDWYEREVQTLDIPYYNPFPLTNQEKQILVVTAIVILAVVAIALIPATGGGSTVLLLA
jgi:nicotinamide riboside kinase